VVDFNWVIVEDLCYLNNIMPVKKARFFSGVSENSSLVFLKILQWCF
jgi:hypothetical protein